MARKHFGIDAERPLVARADAIDYLLSEATLAPELWNQKSFLARALCRYEAGAIRDEGIVSLHEFVDSEGPDGVAIAVETDESGDIHPAVYVRRRGRVDADARLDGSPLHEYRTTEHRRQLASLLGDILG
jgi:hypothetical protein